METQSMLSERGGFSQGLSTEVLWEMIPEASRTLRGIRGPVQASTRN